MSSDGRSGRGPKTPPGPIPAPRQTDSHALRTGGIMQPSLACRLSISASPAPCGASSSGARTAPATSSRRNSRVLPAFMIATVQVASRASLVLLVQRETAWNWTICVQTSHCSDLTASGNIRRSEIIRANYNISLLTLRDRGRAPMRRARRMVRVAQLRWQTPQMAQTSWQQLRSVGRGHYPGLRDLVLVLCH